MSTIAKVFVVLNLVLAVAFMIFTLTLYSKRVDWKDQYQREVIVHDKDVKERDATIAERDDKIDKLEKAVDDEHKAKLDAQSHNQDIIDRWKNELLEKQRLQVRYDTLVGQLQDQQEAYKRQAEDLKKALETIQGQQKFVEQVKRNNEELKRQRVAADARVNRLKAELHAVQDQRRHDAEELAQARYILNKLQEHINIAEILGEPSKGPLGEPIRGKVVAVKGEQHFVALSVGMDDGVRKGYEFTISRTAGGPGTTQFVAKVKVSTVMRDHCGCVVLVKGSRDMPKEGDDALCRGFGGAPYGTYGTYEPVETIGTVPQTVR